MLHLVDYLIVLFVLFLSVFIGFAPKILTFFQRLKLKRSNNKNAAKLQANNEPHSDDNHFDEELAAYAPSLATMTDAESDINKTKSLEYNARFAQTKTNTPTTSNDNNSPPQTNIFLTTISLVIGFQTTISIVGLPLEFYNYSFKSMQICLCLLLAPFLIAYFFVPFLYKIKSKSLYEYLDDKFDGHRTVKYFTILISVLFQFVFASCVLFSTAVSIQQILPANLSIMLWQICLFIGLFSALLAFFGLQSVVWANFVQYIIMVGCMVIMIILGIINYGNAELRSLGSSTDITALSSFKLGLASMWNTTKAVERDHLFVFKENFRDRYTFWNCLIGMTFNTIPSYCLTQQSFMRIKQAKTVKSAKILVMSIAPFGIANMSLILLFGYVIFSFYFKCGDPLSLKLIKNQNQLLSRFLIQFYDDYVGLLGMYIALLVSSAIGTLSSVLAALAVTLSEDILKKISLTRNKNAKAQSELSASRVENMSTLFDINNELNHNDQEEEKTFLKKKRRMSVLQNEMIYLEEMLTLQINRLSVTKRKKKKLIKKYSPSFAKKLADRKLVFSIILVSSGVLIACATFLEKIPGSLSSIAFSMLNAIHGPVFFIYLSACFNKYSMKRYKYAMHRSTTSKLRNFKFNHVDVILSCVVSILFVEFLFFAKLYTFESASSFYTKDKEVIRANISHEYDLEFCKYESDQVRKLQQNASITNVVGTEKSQNENLSLLNYFYAISFNWYPCISFFMCVLQVFCFNMLRAISNVVSSLFFTLRKK